MVENLRPRAKAGCRDGLRHLVFTISFGPRGNAAGQTGVFQTTPRVAEKPFPASVGLKMVPTDEVPI